MKNKGITLVSLVVTVIVLILLAGVSLNLTLGENGIITMARRAKENIELAQIEEEKMLNELYTQIELDGGFSEGLDYDAILKLYEFKKAIADYIEEAGGVKPDNAADTTSFGKSIKGIVAEVTKDATANEEQIIEGKIAWVKGNKITGTMKNNGELNGNLNCSQVYTIPAGFTNGGTIIANSLASQTQATAEAKDIVEGKTAYVNGNIINGTGKLNQSSCNVLSNITSSASTSKISDPKVSYTVQEEGNYMFWFINSGTPKMVNGQRTIKVNNQEISITQIATYRPWYESCVFYYTENVYLKVGDVVEGSLVATAGTDYGPVISIIPVKLF